METPVENLPEQPSEPVEAVVDPSQATPEPAVVVSDDPAADLPAVSDEAPAHVQAASAEAVSAGAKLNELSAFLSSPEFKALPSEYRTLVLDQFASLSGYHASLLTHLKHWFGSLV